MALSNTKGFYVGREFLGKGKRKDGREYVRYKAKFKPFEYSDKQFSITVFSPLNAVNTKQIDELQEGSEYKISFSENGYVNKAGINSISKTAVGFYSADSNSNANVAKVAKAGDTPNFESFLKIYMDAAKKNNIKPNAIHIFGSYIATYKADEYADLIKLCREEARKWM